MEIVNLSCWDHAVHCPFCGTSERSHDLTAEECCRHMLFAFGEGNYYYRSDRFNRVSGLAERERTSSEDFDYGADGEIARGLNPNMPPLENFFFQIELTNYVVFAMEGPSDTYYVGFASLDDELNYWGHTGQSPTE